MRRATGALVAALVAAAIPVTVLAQTPAPSAAPVTSASRWDVEVLGGAMLSRNQHGGKQSFPAAGDPVVTSSPVFPSWSVPSWFFGDGAAFLNNVASEFGVSNRITPLDEWLRPAGLGGGAGQGLFGVRVRRTLTDQYSLEIGAEFSAQPLGVSDGLRAGLLQTAETFQSTFTALFSTGPFSSPVVTAGSIDSAGSSRTVTITAALTSPFGSFGKFAPYAVLGGGVVLPIGDPTTVGLSGRYQFRIAGVAPVDERDELTVEYRERAAFVALGGAGLERRVADRWGIRIDGRVHIGQATTVVEVSSAPSSASATPAGVIESLTYPNLQFSNNSSTGRRSTLGGPGLSAEQVSSGGWQVSVRATAGVFFRF